MTDFNCLADTANLINILSDLVMWKVIGLPLGDWMPAKMAELLASIIETCFVPLGKTI